MDNIKRTTKEKVLLSLCLGGGLGVLPFVIYRLSAQEWVIGAVDLLAVMGMLTLFVYVYKTRKVKLAANLLSLITLTAVVLSIHIKGIQQAYWIFPVMVSFFYLLKPYPGIVYTFLVLILTAPILFQQSTTLSLGMILVPLGITVIFAFIFSKEMDHQSCLLKEQAMKDPLTGSGNRRALSEKLEQLIALYQRSGNKVALLLIDIDHFKAINDSYGHNIGDHFLKEITRIFKTRIRISDSLYRFGGEEFIVLAENTDIKEALILAEKLRSTLQNYKIISKKVVTVSIGVAELKPDETDEQWIKRADLALFVAKDSGRNTVCAAAE